jgi:hypothetical protein
MKPAEMMQRLQEWFTPYTFEDFINDYGPKTHKELEQLERLWFQQVKVSGWFNSSQ